MGASFEGSFGLAAQSPLSTKTALALEIAGGSPTMSL